MRSFQGQIRLFSILLLYLFHSVVHRVLSYLDLVTKSPVVMVTSVVEVQGSQHLQVCRHDVLTVRLL